ncbi:nicotinamide mononucleotide transporter [Deinobacterium chartae]|uniref:Nicotinamide mononucleotide transporter n=1 Tax=Deinobacterium chartae TaxID=521158 RepID=A0A841I0W9_9DEIO|nr:nicotinamide mononucleotide transporter family protein [Deinobacterium chartae]MBB6099317.1 nicotinamide mononucleotide transporter [Deinobacterium chartae]
MNLMGFTVPLWVLDWTGSLLVVASLLALLRKHPVYWHFSNASLLPYFLLFVSGGQYILAGLQVSYLIFGLHGMYLWRLERGRDAHGQRFNEALWYNLGWMLTLLIFAYTVWVTRFSDGWSYLQFVVVSLALVANWATTRRWTWSWYVWLGVNTLQAVLFAHLGLWAQFALQFVLFGLSLRGLVLWSRDDRARLAHA